MPDETTDYAAKGTFAHAVAAMDLAPRDWARGEQYPANVYADYQRYKNRYAARFVSIDVRPYVRAVAEERRRARVGGDSLTAVELRLDLGAWVPHSFGTADAIVVRPGVVQVFDLKYGKGVKVSAEGNPQLRIYGLGAMDHYFDWGIRRVELHIVQPRLDWHSTELLTAGELTAWGEQELRPAAERAWRGPEEYEAGSWCRFCKAKGVCPAHRRTSSHISTFFTE